MEYQCEHIESLISSGHLDNRSFFDEYGREGVPVLHELHKDGDYYTTRERDRLIECVYCPICGKLVDAARAAKIRDRERDDKIRTIRQGSDKLSFCGFCNKDVKPVPVATRRRRHFIYLCPECGGKVTLGKTRRTIDTAAGVIQGRISRQGRERERGVT